MKTFKLFNILVASTAAVTPVLFSVSCSKNTEYDKVADEIKETAIKEFIALNKYPRKTGHTRPVCEYLKKRVKEILPSATITEDSYRNAEVKAEFPETYETITNGNIMFDIPATEGCESYPKCILQGHMDMVLAGEPEAVAKAETEGIEVFRGTDDGKEVLHSKDYKTSLGADNGVGIAMILAMMQNPDVKHGYLRVILTTDEEGGMKGAGQVNSDWLNTFPYLINIDNENIGEMIVGSAGSIECKYSNTYTELTSLVRYNLDTDKFYKIKISGLLGGHSGSMINKGRANAINLMGKFLNMFESDPTYSIAELTSPESTATNKIYQECYAVIRANEIDYASLLRLADVKQQEFRNLWPNETNLTVTPTLTEWTGSDTAYGMSTSLSLRINALFNRTIYGPYKWFDAEHTKVKVSDNVGPVLIEQPDPTEAKITCKLYNQARCGVQDDQEDMKEYCAIVARDTLGLTPGEGFEILSDSPCWAREDNNKLRELCKDGFKRYGVTPVEDVPHAGVENAYFVKKATGGIETVSIGPTINGAHETKETLYLDTLVELTKTVLYMLEKLGSL